MPRQLAIVGNEEVWVSLFRRAVAAGKTVFVSAGTTRMARKLVAWCAAQGVRCKLYTGAAEHKMAKKEFEQPIDASWEGVQVIVATATLTVAVDPQVWHCDLCMVETHPWGATYREQRQASERSVGPAPLR